MNAQPGANRAASGEKPTVQRRSRVHGQAGTDGALHPLLVLLGDLVLGEIRGHMDHSQVFASWVWNTGPRLLRKMLAADVPSLQRVLTPDEMEDIRELVGSAPLSLTWSGGFPPYLDHKRWINTVRESLTLTSANEFDALGVAMTRQLRQKDLRLVRGIEIVATWMEEIDQFERAMQAGGSRQRGKQKVEAAIAPSQCGKVVPAVANDASTPTAVPIATPTAGPVVKKQYAVTEVATMLDKDPYTVREWCRLGRVHASKRPAGRGAAKEWNISREEVQRIQDEGLLPEH